MTQPSALKGQIRNALSIDLEDYFMVSAFESHVKKTDWGSYESRIEINTDKLLDILSVRNIKATFFTVGWVADHHPALVRRVQSMGHEIACHGYFHRLLYHQTPEEFREDTRRAKLALEKVTQTPVIGYRAPSFSLTEKTKWALTILKEEGFVYDASLLPAHHARGGMAGGMTYPHWTNGLMEFPMSTLNIGGIKIPFSGGGYFRLFPYRLISHGINASLRRKIPAIFYLHPWEFDPDQPRISGMSLPMIDRFKHFVNLEKTEAKVRRLLQDFQFGTVREVLINSLGA